MEEQSLKTLSEMNESIRVLSLEESKIKDELTIISTEISTKETKNAIENGDSIQNLTEEFKCKCSITENGTDESKMKDLDNSECSGDTIDSIGSVENSLSEIDLNDNRSLLTKNIQFSLKDRWQLWNWKADNGKRRIIWKNALKMVCTFGTVEEFWRLYHQIKGVRFLTPANDYCVFKEGVKPMWEDPKNINGGRWLLTLPRDTKTKESHARLDKIWLETLLILIGDGFGEYSNDVCGAVVNIRSKADKISIWTANSSDTIGKLKIGEILKLRTNYKGSMKYESHTSTRSQTEKAGKHPPQNWLTKDGKRNLEYYNL